MGPCSMSSIKRTAFGRGASGVVEGDEIKGGIWAMYGSSCSTAGGDGNLRGVPGLRRFIYAMFKLLRA